MNEKMQSHVWQFLLFIRELWLSGKVLDSHAKDIRYWQYKTKVSITFVLLHTVQTSTSSCDTFHVTVFCPCIKQ
jgi:hypothetical protein